MDESCQEGANAHSAEIPARYAGQDIFVADDPAVQGRPVTQTTRPTVKKEPAIRASGSDLPANSDLRIEKLTYIHQMLGELRKLSLSLNEPMVSYLLEMALLEADTALNVGQFRREMSSNGNIPIL